MILRPLVIEDYQFVYETLLDWPLTHRGPTTLDKAISWTRRWIARNDEVGLIGEERKRVGLISYRPGKGLMEGAVYVDYLAVHPDHRQKGHANAMVKALRDKLVSDGVKVGVFDALPGPIQTQVMRGKFQRLDEKTGHSGLPLLGGRITADMEI